MQLARIMRLWGLGAMLVISGCSNNFTSPDLDRTASVNAHAAGGETFELGDFALYMPATADAPRAVIVALGGPNTRGFVTGESFGAPLPEVEVALQTMGQSLRALAAEHRIAILGTSFFGPAPLPPSAESDELIFDALRDGAEASGRPGLTGVPILLYGISGGSSEAARFAERYPERVAGLFLKVPEVAPTMTTEAQRQIPVFIAQAELDAFVDNAAVAATFSSNRANGAVWALAKEGGVPHHALTPVHRQNTIAWMDGVLDRRIAGGSGRIKESIEQSGWLGNPSTGGISAWGAYGGDRSTANWLPTQAAAEQWRALAGF